MQDFFSTKTTTVVSNPDPFSTVAHLHLDTCTLVSKPSYPLNETWAEKQERVRALVGMPPLLAEDASEIRQAYELDAPEVELKEAVVAPAAVEVATGPTISRLGDWIAFAEVTAFKAGSKAAVLSLEDEVKACFANLRGWSDLSCTEFTSLTGTLPSSAARFTLRDTPLPCAPHALPLPYLDVALSIHQRHLHQILWRIAPHPRLRRDPTLPAVQSNPAPTKARGSRASGRRAPKEPSRAEP